MVDKTTVSTIRKPSKCSYKTAPIESTDICRLKLLREALLWVPIGSERVVSAYGNFVNKKRCCPPDAIVDNIVSSRWHF